MKKFIVSVIIGILVVGGLVVAGVTYLCQDDWCYVFPWQKQKLVHSFDDCSRLGYPILETFPEQCRVGTRTFTRNIPPPTTQADVSVQSPLPNTTVTSPLAVQGQAVGSWFFEASFPVKLLSASNTIIAQTTAHAQGNWMTPNLVPFTATLTFPSQPPSSTGTLVLEKDNPSGEPQNAASFTIPVQF